MSILTINKNIIVTMVKIYNYPINVSQTTKATSFIYLISTYKFNISAYTKHSI